MVSNSMLYIMVRKAQPQGKQGGRSRKLDGDFLRAPLPPQTPPPMGPMAQIQECGGGNVSIESLSSPDAEAAWALETHAEESHGRGG